MKRTPLYSRHLDLGARIIDFGGWDMPVQYTGVIDEHRATREAAGLFDICHMGEIDVIGPSAFELLQWTTSRNLEGQKIGQMKLSVITNEQGGIIDDLTVYRLAEEHYRLVTNASRTDNDYRWILKIKEEKGITDVQVIDATDKIGKVDIQGPRSQAILQKITTDDLSPLKFYYSVESKIQDIPALISRSGYTGEDGFEIYTDAGRIGEIWDSLLEAGAGHGLKPVGLGARDTLRLECGMMLYGNDMDETTTPFEVVYGWITDLDKNFIGCENLRRQKEDGVKKKLVGFEMVDRGIARHGYEVLKNGREIGEVTSGTFVPTVKKAIGMAFVPVAYKEPGTEISIRIRNKEANAQIVS
ncbi:MAG: glycine cleavage system aminomethyltransferase GcvT, partial [Deltaproteobacteria bacterium]|nr:glycine cleavage system aminomethyltransferase GcvT [Deltaproteobacteria bacterium]